MKVLQGEDGHKNEGDIIIMVPISYTAIFVYINVCG